MYTAGYPGLESHIQAHRALIERLNTDVRPLEEGFSVEATLEVLGDWFKTHTTGVDRLFGAFLAAKGD